MAPLYTEIERDLVKKIECGELVPNEPIPTETELCQIYGVSRITVRRAVERLVAARMIYRRRGVGTFVNRPDTDGRSLRLFGHMSDVLTFDQKLSTRIFKRGPETAPPSICRAFEVAEGSKLYTVSAVNFLDKNPYAVTYSFFPDELAATVRKLPLGDGKTAIRHIEEKTGIRVRSGEQTIDPGKAQGKVASLLRLKPGTPMLVTTRVYYADDPRPIEAVLVHYHPERYRFRVELLTTDSFAASSSSG